MNPGRLMGLFVGAILGLFAVVGVAKSRVREAREGWNLVPVVVAATDLPANTELTFDLLSQRSTPEQFASPSYVTPDLAYKLVGQKLTGALAAGDPITWQLLVSGERQERISECANDIAAELERSPKNPDAATALAEKWFKEHAP